MKSSPARERHDGETKYKGVRKRKWGKWVSEIRLPNSRERIWLGSYDSPEKAARAFDAALFCLRGPRAAFNFPHSVPDIPRASHLSPAQIQAAASRFAAASSSAAADPPPPSPPEGDLSSNVLDRSIWDNVGSTSTNNTDINCLNNCNSYSYGYDSFPGQGSGSGYPSEYGIFQGFDDLSTDFYVPTSDYNVEESYDSSLNNGSFLWNF